MNFLENARLPRNIQGSFTCRKSTTWENGCTSLPKEGVLRIFSPWKIRRLRPGLNPQTWVPKASTLPLDLRSRLVDVRQLRCLITIQCSLACFHCHNQSRCIGTLWVSCRTFHLEANSTFTSSPVRWLLQVTADLSNCCLFTHLFTLCDSEKHLPVLNTRRYESTVNNFERMVRRPCFAAKAVSVVISLTCSPGFI